MSQNYDKELNLKKYHILLNFLCLLFPRKINVIDYNFRSTIALIKREKKKKTCQ